MLMMKTKRAVKAMRRRSFLMLGAAVFAALLPAMAAADAYEDYFQAVQLDNVTGVSTLLQRGFDPNTVEEKRGDSGLILALRENAMRVFKVLINARDVNLEIRTRNGDTALMLAAFKANYAAVEALLAKGAEVNQPGWAALHYAAASGNNDIVQLLLDHFAYIDAESPNKTTPIMMAARSGHILTVKLLLDEGADVTLKNETGMTAIDFARKFGHKDIAEGLTYRLEKASGKR